MESKFQYWILPERTYTMTVEDHDLQPYTFTATGKDIIGHFRREALLDKLFEDAEKDL